MKEFLKFMLASFVGSLIGFILGLILVTFYVFAQLGGTFAKLDYEQKQQAKIKSNSVLEIDLSGEIVERGEETFLDQLFPGEFDTPLGLDEILASIEKAREDDRVSGILIRGGGVSTGMANLESIYEALEDFKTSDKFLAAAPGPQKFYTQKGYALASLADKKFMDPVGFLDFRGLSAEYMFFKNTLDMLGIDLQVFAAGDFKTAPEPFQRTDMSEASKKQTIELLTSIYDKYLSMVSAGNGLPKDSLRAIAEEMRMETPEDALKQKMIDSIAYEDQVLSWLADEAGVDMKDLNLVGLAKYKLSLRMQAKRGRKSKQEDQYKIAVIYAEGSIVDGDGSDGSIGSTDYTEAIREARLDKDVRAIVLRVNSGGGSAIASEAIWRELTLAKEENDLPVITSMGNVAASGGYYIAAPSDSILAQSTTVTGSIGVFFMLPNMQNFFNEKLGITFDGVKTSKYADMLNLNRPLTDEERDYVNREVERIYKKFKQRVAEGRNLDIDSVETIAQGRVWTGTQALEIGLVDKIGDLDDAIAVAAGMADLEDYEIDAYPREKDAIADFFKRMTGGATVKANLKAELGQFYNIYRTFEKVDRMRGMQAVMPFEINIR